MDPTCVLIFKEIWEGEDFFLLIWYGMTQFSRHGIPDKLITDNGPQFSSIIFKQYSKEYGFQHQTASPHYLQSNGLAEKAVQTAKNLIKKAILDKRDPFLALLEYWNTPISDTLGSPAQRLMGWRTKTLLSISNKLYNQRSSNHKLYSRNSETGKHKKIFTMIVTQ